MTDKNIEALVTKTSLNAEQYRWATFIPDRWPKLKVHRMLNHVSTALKYRDRPYTRPPSYWYDQGIKVYELHGGEWLDYTEQWVAKSTDKLEEQQRQIEADRRERALCSSPCSHCTVRGPKSNVILELAKYKHLVMIMRGATEDEWSESVDALREIIIEGKRPKHEDGEKNFRDLMQDAFNPAGFDDAELTEYLSLDPELLTYDQTEWE